MTTSPFLKTTEKPFVAIAGKRNGYIQLATSHEIHQYAGMPDDLLLASKAWAIALEKLGARRVYWITLSEAVHHLHIHLYPRWDDDEPKGLPLFEQRDNPNQPAWTPDSLAARETWATHWHIEMI